MSHHLLVAHFSMIGKFESFAPSLIHLLPVFVKKTAVKANFSFVLHVARSQTSIFSPKIPGRICERTTVELTPKKKLSNIPPNNAGSRAISLV